MAEIDKLKSEYDKIYWEINKSQGKRKHMPRGEDRNKMWLREKELEPIKDNLWKRFCAERKKQEELFAKKISDYLATGNIQAAVKLRNSYEDDDIMNPNIFCAKMSDLPHYDGHEEADAMMVYILNELGYSKGIWEYLTMEKWYA